MFFTYHDAVEHLVDYLGGSFGDVVVRDSKRAVQEALREIANAHNWTYLYANGRVITPGTFTGGTFAYTQTGGTYERMATISGATWPAWAASGVIRVGTVNYRVAELKSPTVVTLDPQLNPGADLASGTLFVLYQDSFILPADYVSQDQALYEMNFGGMQYCHPREWLYENRYIFAQGVPQCYTVSGDAQAPGRLFLRIFPFPTDTKTIDFVYKRRPRAMSNYKAAAGTASVSANSNVVTGTGTAFVPSMVGSVIRLSGNTTAPTSWVGTNPPAFESVVQDYISPTSISTFDPSPVALSGVANEVSDAVDVEVGAMLNAYLRCIEKHIGMSRSLKDKPSASAQYRDALAKAKEADSRSFAGRYEGQLTKFRQRLRDMPLGPDQP